MSTARSAKLLQPIVVILRRAAGAQEPYVRRNAIAAWSELIKSRATSDPAETRAATEGFADTLVSIIADKEAYAEEDVLRAAQSALRDLPRASLEQTVADLKTEAAASTKPERAARAAWLLLSIPRERASRFDALRRPFEDWRLARLARLSGGWYGDIPTLALSIVFLGALWAGLTAAISGRFSIGGGADDSIFFATGVLICPVVIASWTSTPWRLLPGPSSRLIEVSRIAFFVAVANCIVWYLLEDINTALSLAVFSFGGTVFARLAVAYVHTAAPGAAVLRGGIAGCTGAVWLVPAAAMIHKNWLPGIQSNPQIDAYWWAMLPSVAAVGIALAIVDSSRKPRAPDVSASTKSARPWGLLAGGAALVAVVAFFYFGVATAERSLFPQDPEKSLSEKTCPLPAGQAAARLTDIKLGTNYGVDLCPPGQSDSQDQVVFFTLLGDTAGGSVPTLQLWFRSASNAPGLVTSNIIKAPAVTYGTPGKPAGALRGTLCVDGPGSPRGCQSRSWSAETLAALALVYWTSDLDDARQILIPNPPSQAKQPNAGSTDTGAQTMHLSIAYSRDPAIVTAIHNGARGDDLRKLLPPTAPQ